MLARWSMVLVTTLTGCGRSPLDMVARDGAAHAQAAAASDAESTTVPTMVEPRDSGLASTDARDGQARTDACVPVACQDPACFPAYCGDIGDGCGSVLHCGGCAAGWSCEGGQCFPDDCIPITCDTATPFPYCGRIGNGCGGTLDCACPNPAWTCVGHVCNAVASGCVPLPGCETSWGDELCGGLIGDGCGAVLDCRRECSQARFVCEGNRCVDHSDGGPPPVPVPPPPRPPAPPAPPPAPPPPCPPPPPPPPPSTM